MKIIDLCWLYNLHVLYFHAVMTQYLHGLWFHTECPAGMYVSNRSGGTEEFSCTPVSQVHQSACYLLNIKQLFAKFQVFSTPLWALCKWICYSLIMGLNWRGSLDWHSLPHTVCSRNVLSCCIQCMYRVRRGQVSDQLKWWNMGAFMHICEAYS